MARLPLSQRSSKSTKTSVILFLLLLSGVVEGHLDVVSDPDGTSLRQFHSNADDQSQSAPKVSKGSTRVLAHEVARQLLAERRIAKLKAHLEQAEV